MSDEIELKTDEIEWRGDENVRESLYYFREGHCPV